MQKKLNFLFVCLGNICRSPMAEAIFNKKVKEKNLAAISNSAGTSAYHINQKPDHRTVKVLENNGIYTHHRAQQLQPEDASVYDFFVGMDFNNISAIREILDVPANRILLMRDYDKVNPGAEVPDPYYGDLRSFEEVYDILSRSIDSFIDQLVPNEFQV